MLPKFYNFLLAFLFCILLSGQAVLASGSAAYDTPVFYSVVYNRIPDEFDYPAVGVVNQSDGDFLGLELGFFNNHPGRVAGAQFGLINMVKSSFNGFQIGLLNAVEGNASGLRLGVINNGECNGVGIQGGFVNDVQNMTGIQAGIFNTAKKNTGIQNGLVNSSIQLAGIQAGVINSSENLTGLQFGIFNAAKKLYGLQLGIFNVADSLCQGMPLGFLSFVRKGGYKALEMGYTTLFPYNMAYKTGVEAFYTYPMVSLDPDRKYGVALGWGAGSKIKINTSIFANPEFQVQRVVRKDFEGYSTLRLNLGYRLNDRFEMLAGPTIQHRSFATRDELKANSSTAADDLFALRKLAPGFQVSFRYIYH